MLLSKIKKTIGKYRMLAPGNIVLAAVSGGPDSVCLLSVLQALAKDLDLALHVAHLDHMFRGKESADEAKFVAAVAEQLGIPATVEQFDVPAFCRERGLVPGRRAPRTLRIPGQGRRDDRRAPHRHGPYCRRPG